MTFDEVDNCTFQTHMTPVPDFYEFAKEAKYQNENVEDFNPKAYIDKMGSMKFSSDYRMNMMKLMDMGYLNFETNLKTLQ